MSRPWYRSIDFVASVLLTSIGVFGAGIYANLSYDVVDPAEYASFPPFKSGVDVNMNDHLGAEYFKIAESLTSGRGYSDPFGTPTGPTAWMPPLLPLYEAGILMLFDGDKTSLMNTIIVSQVLALWLTGVLTLAIARKTAPGIPSLLVTAFMALALIARFHSAFQVTHDSWLVLLAVDFLLAGIVWGRVVESRRRAVLWGVGGGLVTLTSPIVGLCWGCITAAEAIRHREWRRAGLAIVIASLVMSPWVVRNAVVFGRFIPVKSNLAYELYQSQLLNEKGRLSTKVFGTHPYSTNGSERAECAEKGEMAFLDAKRTLFWQSVRQDPGIFREKVYDRFLAVTVDYSPNEHQEYERETLFNLCFLLHAVPFFAAFSLLAMGPVARHNATVWMGLGVAVCYLLPYVIVSYYDRYEFPLWGLKVLLVVWWLEAVRRGLATIFFGIPREESHSGDTTLQTSSSRSQK